MEQEKDFLEEEKELQEATKQDGINEQEEKELYEKWLGDNND